MVDPLQSGIREHYIKPVTAGCRPRGDVTGDPVLTGIFALRAFDHVGGTVQPGEFGIRPTIAEHGRAIPGSTSEIDYALHVGYRDACGEIAARLRALFGEFQVLVRIPAGHFPTVARFGDRPEKNDGLPHGMFSTVPHSTV